MRPVLACVLVLAAACLASCATAPELADARRSGVWGYLSLVPRQEAGSDDGYGDRRLRDVELVDYTRPGFAVVYLDGAPPPRAPKALAVRGGLAGPRLEPDRAAVGVGAELRVTNRDDAAHVVSCPRAGWLRRLGPGDSLRFRVETAGELDCFVPEGSAGARIFVAPGPFAVVDDAGRYQLMEVEPGSRRLHAWHPRLPPRSRTVELAPGRVLRVDLELGVGLDEGDATP